MNTPSSYTGRLWRAFLAIALPIVVAVCAWKVFAALWPGPHGLGQWLWEMLSDREAFATNAPGLVFVVLVVLTALSVMGRAYRVTRRWSVGASNAVGSGTTAAGIALKLGTYNPGENALRVHARHEAAHVCAVWALGGRTLGVDVITAGDGIGGTTRHQAPHDASYGAVQWYYLVVDVAGHVSDLDTDIESDGAVSDLSRATTHALGVLSSGQRPAGYDGPWTLDGVILHAITTAREVLATESAVYAALTDALVATGGRHHIREAQLLEIRDAAAGNHQPITAKEF